jgi:hypothetical protein
VKVYKKPVVRTEVVYETKVYVKPVYETKVCREVEIVKTPCHEHSTKCHEVCHEMVKTVKKPSHCGCEDSTYRVAAR